MNDNDLLEAILGGLIGLVLFLIFLLCATVTHHSEVKEPLHCIEKGV